eukprot:3935810-Rhodomonas_salina.1
MPSPRCRHQRCDSVDACRSCVCSSFPMSNIQNLRNAASMVMVHPSDDVFCLGSAPHSMISMLTVPACPLLTASLNAVDPSSSTASGFALHVNTSIRD